MTQPFIRPEEVSPSDARRVLDFLNAATTPEEIASAIEFPGELDIGLRLARRILDRRRQLGSFTSLQQVADVPLIGPERFTEIVRALTGAAAPVRPGDTLSELMEEVRALRREVEALRSATQQRDRVTLRPLQQQPFLGQPVTIMARVTDSRGETPRVDAPLTLVASWGRLAIATGYGTRQGQSITARTGLDGTVRLVLLPPTSEDLWDSQQQAVESMLRLLDAQAATPRDTQAGLQAMARQYAWESNLHFRRAVDIYFRDFRQHIADTINSRDFLKEWSYFDSTVVAYVLDDGHGDAPDGSVQAAAALSLRFKDWLGPWLETYLALSRSESTLGGEIQGLKRRAEEAGTLLNRVYGRVHDYVSRQRGLVGQYVGQKVAETVIQDFVSKGMEDLPVQTRLAMFPGLEVASSAVASAGGLVVLGGLSQTRADLRQELDSRIAQIDVAGIGSLSDRVGQLETRLEAEVTTRLDTFDSRLGTLENVSTTLQNDMRGLDTRLVTLEDTNRTIGADVASFNTRLATLEGDSTRLSERVVGLEGSVARLGNNVLSTRVDLFRATGTLPGGGP